MSRATGDSIRGARSFRSRLSTLSAAVVVAAVAACVTAPGVSAQGQTPFHLQVTNDTAHPISLAHIPGTTWQTTGSGARPGTTSLFTGTDKDRSVEPKKTKSFYGGRSSGSGGFQIMGLAFRFADAEGNFQNPLAVGETSSGEFLSGQVTAVFDQFGRPNKYTLVGELERWFPANPLQQGTALGKGAGGLFCIVDVKNSDPFTVSLTVTSDRTKCPVTPNLPAPPARSGVPDSPSPAPAYGGGERQRQPFIIASLAEQAAFACKLNQSTAPAWSKKDCSTVTTPDQWGLAELETQVRKAEMVNKPAPVKQMNPIFRTEQGNQTPVSQDAGREVTITKGVRTEIQKCESNTLGGHVRVQTGLKIAPFGPFGSADSEVEVQIDYNHTWNDCNTTGTEEQKSATTRVNATAAPNGLTRVRAFQYHGTLPYTYDVDLTLGSAGTAQPVKTPMARALGMSPSRWQPCMGYLGRSADPNSLTGILQRATDAGYLKSVKYNEANKGFRAWAKSLENFKAQPAGDGCPGWPSGYPAAMIYKGQASADLDALAPVTTSGPFDSVAQGMDDLLVCSWFTSYKKNPSLEEKPELSNNSRGTCDQMAPNARAGDTGAGDDLGAGSGSVVDGEEERNDDELEGTNGTDLLMADDDRARETVSGGDGRDVVEGAADDQLIRGGDGADIITAASGADVVDGGRGADSIDGGDGDDQLRDEAGDNGLFGGEGADLLKMSGDASGGLMGEAGDDRLVLDGDGPVTLAGGEGDDVYRLLRGADPRRTIEFPGAGQDTIVAGGDVKVPPEFERVEAEPGSDLQARAGPGDQTLIGGGRGDRLAGGDGGDRVDGGGGNDLVVLDSFGYDEASGGPGADEFMPNTTPIAGLAPGAVRNARLSAHRIEDLRPGGGDRIVLAGSSFGRAVGRLEQRMVVRYGASPEAKGRRPQLLFSRQNSLLRFDRDGRGPLPGQVVAILEGFDRVPLGAIEISPGE